MTTPRSAPTAAMWRSSPSCSSTLPRSFLPRSIFGSAIGSWAPRCWSASPARAWPGTAAASAPSISADGRFVAFSSSASNLVPFDTNDVDDIFVHDRDADGNGIFDEPGEAPLTRVSISSNLPCRPTASARVRRSAAPAATSRSTPAPPTGPRSTARPSPCRTSSFTTWRREETIWVNPPTQNSTNGFNNHHSGDASISADGRYVAFGSQATHSPRTLNHFGSSQIFVRDTCAGAAAGCAPATEWASPQVHVDFQPSDTFKPAISANGRFVAFESRSTVLVPGDTNEVMDIFVFDRQTRAVTRVNVSSAGEQAADNRALDLFGQPARVDQRRRTLRHVRILRQQSRGRRQPCAQFPGRLRPRSRRRRQRRAR